MKKVMLILCAFGLLLLAASPLHAGGIVNKSNQSADYFRTLNRNAGTDFADIVVFNPAGVMKMDNGAYVKLDIMYIEKPYYNTLSVPGVGELEQDEPSILPGFFALYKQDKWAGFFAFTIPGGGGTVEYNNGSATTVGASLALTGGVLVLPSIVQGEGVYYGYTVGGSYAFNDVWSIAAGMRYVDAYKEGTLALSTAALGFPFAPITIVDYEKDAGGWGGFVGLNIAPTNALNIGLTYQSNIKLDFETTMKQDNLPLLGGAGALDSTLVNGAKQREDLPGLIGVGVSYKINPKLRVEADFTYYLEKEAKWEGRLHGQGNSWEAGIMGEWTFNSRWKASLGYLHSEIEIDPNYILPEAPELTANTIGAGVVWSPTSTWAITFGAVRVFYDSETSTQTSPATFAPAGTEYEKEVWSIFAGLQWKFL